MNNDIRNENEEFEKEIDTDTRFDFPQILTEHNVLGKHLIIAPENANWLVMEDNEYEAFLLFKEAKSIEEVQVELSQIMGEEKASEAIQGLIAQILGKEFLFEAKPREKSLFKAATLNLTEGCNLRCATCLWSATVPGPGECLFEHWMKFIREFKNFGGKLVTLTGGEPMLNHDCLRIIQETNKLGINVVLLTNGTLITNDNVGIIGKNCGEVRVSIDGPDEKTNDSIRGQGTFAKALYAIKELSAYPDCNPSITMTPTPATISVFKTKLTQFVDLVHNSISPDIAFRITRELENGRDLPSMSRADKLAFQAEVISMCNEQLGQDYTDKVDAAGIVPNRRIFGCGLGELFTVRANGDIRVCAYVSHAFCNIKSMQNGQEFLNVLAEKLEQLIFANRVETINPCNKCDLKYFCGGKCRKDNNAECGDPAVCSCNLSYRVEWYERLVNTSRYVVEPVVDQERR